MREGKTERERGLENIDRGWEGTRREGERGGEGKDREGKIKRQEGRDKEGGSERGRVNNTHRTREHALA